MDSKEAIEAEEALLRETQAAHVDSMRRSGLLARALKAAGISEEGTINPVLFKVNNRNASGQPVTRIELRLHDLNSSGATVPRFSAITESLGSLTLPMEPFTPQDAADVQTMMHGLEEARDFGLLPHLSPSMDHIINPYTGMMLQPERPKSD